MYMSGSMCYTSYLIESYDRDLLHYIRPNLIILGLSIESYFVAVHLWAACGDMQHVSIHSLAVHLLCSMSRCIPSHLIKRILYCPFETTPCRDTDPCPLSRFCFLTRKPSKSIVFSKVKVKRLLSFSVPIIHKGWIELAGTNFFVDGCGFACSPLDWELTNAVLEE